MIFIPILLKRTISTISLTTPMQKSIRFRIDSSVQPELMTVDFGFFNLVVDRHPQAFDTELFQF